MVKGEKMLKEQVAKMMYDIPCKRYKCDFWDVQGNYCYANSADKNASYNCPMSTAILNLFKAEIDKLTVMDNPYPITTRFRSERYIDEPLHIGFGVGSKEQLHHTKKQLLDLMGL